MPTYKNNTTNQIYWNNTLWNPGDKRALNYYVPHTDLNLTLISTTPTVKNPILYSEDVTDDVVDIPYGKRIVISGILISGPGSIKFGDEEIELTDSIGYQSVPLLWDKVQSIEITGTVKVLIEEVM